MIGCFPMQALAFLAVFVYATHATQAIAFEWKPGLTEHNALLILLRRRNVTQNVGDWASPTVVVLIKSNAAARANDVDGRCRRGFVGGPDNPGLIARPL